jgi:YD repeat-containing protein
MTFFRPVIKRPSIIYSLYAFIEQNANGSFTLTFKDGTKHQFSSSGRLLSMTDRDGNQTTLNYDANNNLTGITDASGRTLTINMSGGLVQSISDSLDVVAAYSYYPNTSNLQTVTYQDGSQYKFEYDTTTVMGKTFLKTVKDANDKILETHEYDSQGRDDIGKRRRSRKIYFRLLELGIKLPGFSIHFG